MTASSEACMRGSEAVVRMLQSLDVKVIFGLCGDTTLPLYEEIGRASCRERV